jgi:hypothetical protein
MTRTSAVRLGYTKSLMASTWLTRSRRHWIAAWLLPALCLHALIPVGFMPGSHAGFGAALKLCDGQGMDMGHSKDGSLPGGPGAHHEATCAFAASALSAPPPSVPVTSHHVSESVCATCAESISTAMTVLPRAQSPRGPPR